MLDTNALCFAEEELVYLLRALSIETLPGLEPQPLAHLTDEQRALLMSMADRTLRARGIVSRESQEMSSMHPLITGILRDCALPGYILLVDIVLHDGHIAPSLYHLVPHGIIHRFMPEPGIHQFLLLPKPRDILEHLFLPIAENEVANTQTPSEPETIGRLHTEKLNAALTCIATAPEQAQTILAQELSATATHMVYDFLTGYTALWHLALQHDTIPQHTLQPHKAVIALTIIERNEQYLLLWRQFPDATKVELLISTAIQMRAFADFFLERVAAIAYTTRQSPVAESHNVDIR